MTTHTINFRPSSKARTLAKFFEDRGFTNIAAHSVETDDRLGRLGVMRFEANTHPRLALRLAAHDCGLTWLAWRPIEQPQAQRVTFDPDHLQDGTPVPNFARFNDASPSTISTVDRVATRVLREMVRTELFMADHPQRQAAYDAAREHLARIDGTVKSR